MGHFAANSNDSDCSTRGLPCAGCDVAVLYSGSYNQLGIGTMNSVKCFPVLGLQARSRRTSRCYPCCGASILGMTTLPDHQQCFALLLAGRTTPSKLSSRMLYCLPYSNGVSQCSKACTTSWLTTSAAAVLHELQAAHCCLKLREPVHFARRLWCESVGGRKSVCLCDVNWVMLLAEQRHRGFIGCTRGCCES